MMIFRRIFFAAALFMFAVGAAAATPEVPTAIQSRLDHAKGQMIYDPAKSLKEARAAEAAARKLPSDRTRAIALATAQWLQAEALLRTDSDEAARPLIGQALNILRPIEEPIKLRGDLLLSRAFLARKNNDAARALTSCHDAYRIFQQIGDKRSQSRALQMIASLYEFAGDKVQAEKYYDQASQVYDGDPSLAVALYNNHGNVLMQLEQYDKALREYKKALDFAQNLDSALLETRVLGNIARVQVESGNLEAAEKALNKGFEAAKTEEAGFYRRQLLATEARVAFLRDNLVLAKRLIGKSLANPEPGDGSGNDYYRHYVAYQIYAATGDTGLSLQHLEIAKRVKDEATKVASTANAALAAARFDFKNQELRIAQLKAQELRRNVAYERSQARFQRIIFIGVAAGAVVIVALLSVGLVTIRRSRNQVRAANIDLAETNTALERALAAKTEFLATTSHEIRTPLNGILGMTQVMLADGGLPESTRDRIGVVHSAGTAMRALVDDILDVAKMEDGKLTVEMLPMNLAATLADVARIWEDQARERGLAFTLDLAEAPGWIENDAGRVRQIVFNLLSNALKFTRDGGIGLRARTIDEGDGAHIRIAVSDSGIGIPEDKQAAIFESFQQVDTSTTRNYGGTGLGLTICRNLAVALGGDILVESTPGKGATFTVDLPLVPAEAPDTRQADEDGGPGLLILDGNPIARGMLKAVLGPRAGHLRFVASSAEAEAALAERDFACLLIDEACIKAEENDPLAIVATLAITATRHNAVSVLLWKSPDEATGAAIAASGIDKLIEKPIAGAALAEQLFGNDNIQPLVSQAA